MKRLDEAQIQERVGALDGWGRQGTAIQKKFTFATFAEAIAFVNKVATLAEAADHHPDFLVEYRNVTLTLSTHSAGGLTANDTDLAAAIDRTIETA